MNSITVVNVKHAAPGSFVYCGRVNPSYKLAGSPLANPFKLEIDTDEERKRLLEEYREWLYEKLSEFKAPQWNAIQKLADLLESQPLSLGCWCAPKACHCDVIADFVRRECARRAAVAAMQKRPTQPPTKRSVSGIDVAVEDGAMGPMFATVEDD